MGTEFLLLGPFLVRTADSDVRVPPGKQRALMAALLLRANHAVSVGELAHLLWGTDPPSGPRVSVQNYVMRLRKALGPVGSRITTSPGGYLIRVEPGELDLDRFADLLHDARKAARDSQWQAAADHASAALELWRGEPLADLGSDLLRAREGPRLAELRLQALETRIDADLHLGRHGEVIGELRQLATENPLRERLHALLMLALYRDGRQAEALAAYQHAREVLVEELGAEPGPDLQHLHQQILTADPALLLPAATVPTPASSAPVPRELPGDVAAFTGRSVELAGLDRLLLSEAGRAGDAKATAAMISAVSGTAGVGKTALAVHWAHRVAGKFPDGQLYVNLRGYDPDQPILATDALAGFLRSLGVSGQDIPPEEAERASRYRSLLTGKRMLVVLDNARTVDQVRPLLPGHPDCRVVVTSRDSLAGLVARDGARRLDLDLLPAADAVALLRELIGPRVDSEPDAAVTLAEQCARLPLALRVAAELAASRPKVPLASLVSELGDQQARLDLLEVGGDSRTAIRAVFSWSYDHLDGDAAHTFRVAGLHPGPDFDTYAAAALAGSTVEQARLALGTLTRAHLVRPTSPDRYGMHDLLRAYARELAAADGKEQPRSALTRLLDHYLYTASVAMDSMIPVEAHRRPRIAPPGFPTPAIADPAAARQWVDSERAVLQAMTVYAAEEGWPGHATRLAATLFRYLERGGYYREMILMQDCARIAARQTADYVAEATALSSIGVAQWRQGHFQAAEESLRQSVALARHAGELVGQARALSNLGTLAYSQGKYGLAAEHFRSALELFRQKGDRTGEAGALTGLGNAHEGQGLYQRASDLYQQALKVCQSIGDRPGEALALGNLGVIAEAQGHPEQAADYHQRALTTFREIRDRGREAHALSSLGSIASRQGCYREAADYLNQALAIVRETGDRSREAACLNGIGEAHLAAGHPQLARAQHLSALGVASQIGSRHQQAKAHEGLGDAQNAMDDPAQARRHWLEALAIFADLGAPDADRLRTRLAAVEGATRQ